MLPTSGAEISLAAIPLLPDFQNWSGQRIRSSLDPANRLTAERFQHQNYKRLE